MARYSSWDLKTLTLSVHGFHIHLISSCFSSSSFSLQQIKKLQPIKYFLLLHLLHYQLFLNCYNQFLYLTYNGFHDFFAINTICILIDCMFSTIFAEKYKAYLNVKIALFVAPWLSSIILTSIIICFPNSNITFNPILNSINLVLFTAAHLLQYCNQRCYYCLTNISLSHQCILRNNVKNMKIISFLCISDSILTLIYFFIYYFLIEEKQNEGGNEKNAKFIVISGFLHNLRIIRCLILPFCVKYFYFCKRRRNEWFSKDLQKNFKDEMFVYFIKYDKAFICSNKAIS